MDRQKRIAAHSVTSSAWKPGTPIPSISMNSQPLASPTASILPNVVIELPDVSFALGLQADIISAAACSTATLPPETLPKTVATTVVVTTAGATAAGAGSVARSEPQNVSWPAMARAWLLETETDAVAELRNTVTGMSVFVAPS